MDSVCILGRFGGRVEVEDGGGGSKHGATWPLSGYDVPTLADNPLALGVYLYHSEER